jgi:hypothetical protein
MPGRLPHQPRLDLSPGPGAVMGERARTIAGAPAIFLSLRLCAASLSKPASRSVTPSARNWPGSCAPPAAGTKLTQYQLIQAICYPSPPYFTMPPSQSSA